MRAAPRRLTSVIRNGTTPIHASPANVSSSRPVGSLASRARRQRPANAENTRSCQLIRIAHGTRCAGHGRWVCTCATSPTVAVNNGARHRYSRPAPGKDGVVVAESVAVCDASGSKHCFHRRLMMALALGAYGARLHRRYDGRDDQLPRLDRRQLGRPVLAPEGLHPGLHHRARLHGQDQARVRQAQHQVIGLSVDPVDNHERWAKDIEETQGTEANYPMIGDTDFKVAKLYDMLPADVAGARRRAPRRQRDGAQRLRHRPGQEDQADPRPTR